jgi:hypothetical protein
MEKRRLRDIGFPFKDNDIQNISEIIIRLLSFPSVHPCLSLLPTRWLTQLQLLLLSAADPWRQTAWHIYPSPAVTRTASVRVTVTQAATTNLARDYRRQRWQARERKLNLWSRDFTGRANTGQRFGDVQRGYRIGDTACYHSVQNLSSSRIVSKNIKIKIYKTIILPVV